MRSKKITLDNKLEVRITPLTFQEYIKYRWRRPSISDVYEIVYNHVDAEDKIKDKILGVAFLANKVVQEIYNFSGYAKSDEQLYDEITTYKDNLLTYEGACEILVLKHGGVEIYKYMLEGDEARRNMIIAAVELLIGVSVKERMMEAIEDAERKKEAARVRAKREGREITQEELDAIAPSINLDPENIQPSNQSSNSKRKYDPEVEAAMRNGKNKSKRTINTINEMGDQDFDKVNEALANALRNEYKNPKSTFDWKKDNLEQQRAENMEDRQILNTERDEWVQPYEN